MITDFPHHGETCLQKGISNHIENSVLLYDVYPHGTCLFWYWTFPVVFWELLQISSVFRLEAPPHPSPTWFLCQCLGICWLCGFCLMQILCPSQLFPDDEMISSLLFKFLCITAPIWWPTSFLVLCVHLPSVAEGTFIPLDSGLCLSTWKLKSLLF